MAIIGSDMQEVIGTAIALYLLSNKHSKSKFKYEHTLEYYIIFQYLCGEVY